MASRAGVILDPGPFSDGTGSSVQDPTRMEGNAPLRIGHVSGMEDLLEHHQARAQAQLAEKFSELKQWQEEQKEILLRQQQQRMEILRAQQEQLQRALAEQRSKQWGGTSPVSPSNQGPPRVSRETATPVTFDMAVASSQVTGQPSLLQRYDSVSLGNLLQRAQDDILQEEEDGSDIETSGSVKEDGIYPLPDSELSDMETPTRKGHKQYYQSTPTQERGPSSRDNNHQIPPPSPLCEDTSSSSCREDCPSTKGSPQRSPSPEPAGFDDLPIKAGNKSKTFEELLEEQLRLEGVPATAPAKAIPAKPKRAFLRKGEGLARFGKLKVPSPRSTKVPQRNLKLQNQATVPQGKKESRERDSPLQMSSGETTGKLLATAGGSGPFKKPVGRAPVSIIKERLSSQTDGMPQGGGAARSSEGLLPDASPVDAKSISMIQAEGRKRKAFDEDSLADFEMLEQAAEDNVSFSSDNSLVVGVMQRAKLRAKMLATSPLKGRVLPTLVSVDTVDDGEDWPCDEQGDDVNSESSKKSCDSVESITSEEEERDSDMNETLKSEGARENVSATKRKVTRGRSIHGNRVSVNGRDSTGERFGRESHLRLGAFYGSEGNSEEVEGDSEEESEGNLDGVVTVIPNSLRGMLDKAIGNDHQSRFDADFGQRPASSLEGRFIGQSEFGNRHDARTENIPQEKRGIDSRYVTGGHLDERLRDESNGDSGDELEGAYQDRHKNHPGEHSESYNNNRLGSQAETKFDSRNNGSRTENIHAHKSDERNKNVLPNDHASQGGARNGSETYDDHVGTTQRWHGGLGNNTSKGRTEGQSVMQEGTRKAEESAESGEEGSSEEEEGAEKSRKEQPGAVGYEFDDDETWGDFSANLSDSSSDSIVVEPSVTSALDRLNGGKSRSVLDAAKSKSSSSGEQDRMTPPPSHLVAKLFPQLKPKEKPKPNQNQAAENAVRASKGRPIGDGLQAKVFKEKLAELENEIERFRRENAALSKLREEREKGLESFKNEVAEFERRKEAELKQIEEYRDRETKKLRKEKKIFEKHQKTARSIPDKKDREEIDKLKGQLTELQDELGRREARWSANTRRMKTRVDGLTEENRQLRDEMEAMRKQQKEELNKAERKKAASRIKALRDASRPKTLIPEVKPGSFQPLPSNLPKHPEMVQSSTTLEKKKRKSEPQSNRPEQVQDISSDSGTSDDEDPNPAPSMLACRNPLPLSPGVRKQGDPGPQERPERDTSGSEEQIHHPDGKVEVVHSDGSRLITFKNGTRKEISSDGQTITVTFFNGDTRQIYPDQRVVYYYAETQITHTTYQDGLEIINFPNNQTEKHYPDGTKEITFPDQTIKYLFQNGGEECVFPDGTVLRVDKSGDRTMEFPNGQREIHTVQYKKREYPDGTVKTIYPDGRQETRYAHGRIRVKDKDGRVLVDQQT